MKFAVLMTGLLVSASAFAGGIGIETEMISAGSKVKSDLFTSERQLTNEKDRLVSEICKNNLGLNESSRTICGNIRNLERKAFLDMCLENGAKLSAHQLGYAFEANNKKFFGAQVSSLRYSGACDVSTTTPKHYVCNATFSKGNDEGLAAITYQVTLKAKSSRSLEDVVSTDALATKGIEVLEMNVVDTHEFYAD